MGSNCSGCTCGYSEPELKTDTFAHEDNPEEHVPDQDMLGELGNLSERNNSTLKPQTDESGPLDHHFTDGAVYRGQ